MKSILQKEKVCYITGRSGLLHKHHIFGGALRKASEEHGFYVYLVPELHNMSDAGVHFNRAFSDDLKRQCQTRFEETHTRREFFSIIHRNYL